MGDGIDDVKRAMRADLRERRQQRSEQANEAAGVGIRDQLDALVSGLGVATMSCYLSTPIEPSTREFLAGAAERGIRVLLPLMRADGLLDWTVADPEAEVVEAALGVPEPISDVLSPLAVHEVDLMVIPAAAVDHRGTRLGWGRGYFDKTLGSMENRPPVYAVIFDSELVEEVPRDVHDQPVTGVVTPTRTVVLTH